MHAHSWDHSWLVDWGTSSSSSSRLLHLFGYLVHQESEAKKANMESYGTGNPSITRYKDGTDGAVDIMLYTLTLFSL